MNNDGMIGLKGRTPEEKHHETATIITICDNLFYGHYINGGDFKSRAEIQENIKNEVKEDMIEFFGKKHKNRVAERMDGTKVSFVYQTIGKNSIEEFINNKAWEYMVARGVADKETIDDINAIALITSVLHLRLDKTQILTNEVYRNVFNKLGYSEDLLNNDDVCDSIIEKFQEEVKGFSIGYLVGDNPKVNADVYAVKMYVEKYKRDLYKKVNEIREDHGVQHLIGKQFESIEEREQSIVDAVDAYMLKNPEKSEEYIKFKDPKGEKDKKAVLTEHFKELIYSDSYAQFLVGEECDPIRDFNRLLHRPFSSSLNESLYNVNGNVLAYYNEYYRSVAFGVFPTDEDIVHEFGHSVTEGGFERNHPEHLSEDKAPYSSIIYRKNEEFNEVCNQYFTVKIMEQRKIKGKSAIVNPARSWSNYENLFPFISPFLEKNLEFIKDTQMIPNPEDNQQNEFLSKVSEVARKVFKMQGHAKDPAEAFERLIGEENFDKIALFCNETLAVYSEKNLEKIESKCQEYGISVEELQEKLYQEKGVELTNTVNDIMTQQDAKRVGPIGALIGNIMNVPTIIKNAVKTQQKTLEDVQNLDPANHHKIDDGMSM